MRTVDVRVGHDDDAVVTAFGDVLVEPNPAADGLDHAHDFFVREHFVFAALVSIDDLTSQREDGLGVSETATLRATTCRVTFYEVEFALLHFVADAISKFAGQAATAEYILSVPKNVFGFLGCFSCFCSEQAFSDQKSSILWVLFEVL